MTCDMLSHSAIRDEQSQLDIRVVMGGSAFPIAHVARCWAAHRRRFVYFAERGELLKIGTSNNVPARMSALGATLLAVMPGGFDVEGQMHRRFEQFSVGHEWFTDVPAIRDFAAALPVPLIPLSPASPLPRGCQVWSLAEAADRLGMPIRQARTNVRATGEIVSGLRALQIGARFSVSKVQLDEFLRTGRVAS